MINLFLTLFFTYLIGFLPGFFIYLMLFKNRKKVFYEAFPLSLIFSFSLLVLPTFCGFQFAGNINSVIYFWIAEFFIVFIIFVITGSYKQLLKIKPREFSFRNNKYLKILLILLVLVIIRAILTPGFQGGDMLRHVTEIRKIIELPNISFGAGFIKEAQGAGSYGYNILHIFLAMVSKISAIDVVDIINFMPIFVCVFLFFAYYYFSKELFDDEKIALYSTIVLFVWELVLNYNFSYPKIDNFWLWSEILPSFFARNIAMFSALAVAINYIRTGTKKCLYLLPIFSLVTAFFHVNYFIYLIVLMGFILVFVFLFRFKEKIILKRAVLSFLYIFIPSAPYAIFISAKLYPVLNRLYGLVIVSGNRPVETVMGLPFLDPFKTIYFGFVHWLACLLMPFLIFMAKKKDYAIYLLALFLGPLLILFNPPVLKILQHFNPALDRAWRINETFPYTQIVGLFVFIFVVRFWPEIKKYFIEKEKWEKIMFGAVFSLIFLTLVFYKPLNIAYFSATTKGHEIERTSYLRESRELRSFIDKEIPVGSVILMDNVISGVWPYYYPHYVVSVNWGINSYVPVNFDQSERYNEVEEYLSQEKLTLWSFEFLSKYGVNYVVVNNRINDNDILMGESKEWPLEKMPFQEYKRTKYFQNKDFQKYPENFSLIYESADLKIYRYTK